MGAWDICRNSAEVARGIVILLISDQGSGATLWVHWRKSSASKQFLALLKAVSDAIASEADWMPAAAVSTSSVRRTLRFSMMTAWMYVMDTLRLLYKGSQAGALWPALRDWLAETGNLQGLWGKLVWCCSGASDNAALSVVHDLVSMTHTQLSQGHLPPALLQHPRVAEALGLVLRTVLTMGFARHYDLDWLALEISVTLLQIENMAVAEPQLWQHLHLPALSLWPYLVGALRRQREGVAAQNEDLQVLHINVCEHADGRYRTLIPHVSYLMMTKA